MNGSKSSSKAPVHNDKPSLNLKMLSSPFSERREMKEIKKFARFFLEGEIMREFLMDEDNWLFIQNVKIKLKENPNEVDSWLDHQLHKAKCNSGNSFNMDVIPPFHHIKKNIEYNSLKGEKESEKNYYSCNGIVKNNMSADSSVVHTTVDRVGELGKEGIIIDKEEIIDREGIKGSDIINDLLAHKREKREQKRYQQEKQERQEQERQEQERQEQERQEQEKQEQEKQEQEKHDQEKHVQQEQHQQRQRKVSSKMKIAYNNNDVKDTSNFCEMINKHKEQNHLNKKNIVPNNKEEPDMHVLSEPINERLNSCISNEKDYIIKKRLNERESSGINTDSPFTCNSGANKNTMTMKYRHSVENVRTNDAFKQKQNNEINSYDSNKSIDLTNNREKKKKKEKNEITAVMYNYIVPDDSKKNFKKDNIDTDFISNDISRIDPVMHNNKYNVEKEKSEIHGGSENRSNRFSNMETNTLDGEITKNMKKEVEERISKDDLLHVSGGWMKNDIIEKQGSKRNKDGPPKKNKQGQLMLNQNKEMGDALIGAYENAHNNIHSNYKHNHVSNNVNNGSSNYNEDINEDKNVDNNYDNNNNDDDNNNNNNNNNDSNNNNNDSNNASNNNNNDSNNNNGGLGENNKIYLKSAKTHAEILIPKMTVKIGRLINEDTDIKLKKIFMVCNNKMYLESFENLIVVNFLKIGRYMSHTLFSRIEKVNEDFITYEDTRKYFCNRFIDGTKDPSYYNDDRYSSSFNKSKKDIHGENSSPPLCSIRENECRKKELSLDDMEDVVDITSNHKEEHIEVPYKKCSIVNFFNAIKGDNNKDYLEFKDFDIYLREVLRRNKSLQFLLEHAEFLERYIESVIVRIYYHIDINDTNKIYLNDLRKHDLAHIWCCLDDTIKVQHVRQYFSYSHFYVYYCTFCQTSSCKDMLIDDNDLYRFDNHSLNDFIVNRIWSRISMKLAGPNQKYMCLNDWIYFIMNYEDMTTNRSIEFWFKLIDLDADCVIRDHEIQVFFNIQMERLKSHYLEEPKFEDWLCQMNDAIQPSNEGNFTLSDFKKNKKYAAKFFGCLVSLSKLLAWESRDAHKELQIETEYPHWTPWEIFCKTKYDELCYNENESYYDDNFNSYDDYDSKNVYM
ncbi:phosphatase 2A regulatory subunit-related protein, putative [Plasmodium malariae]|uniref:Phosphatase 2A regulatory subunit-related protein, putative n=1 Tax=Plasmodium malariae TaxID=5858 RepID=A0A1C3KZA9_PLAMA|nr:phosphatase 2A regulatory subunit-related protein, putative [Plasmodium malariae]